MVERFESGITGVCSPYVVSLCDFAYYVKVLGILLFGMLCLSASRILLVKILLAVCMSLGMVVCKKANSVSFVNCVQLAFL